MADCKEVDDMKHCYENLIVIDVGANLVNKKYNRDLDMVVQRAKDSGVQKIMVPGTSLKTSKEALRLSRIYPGLIYSTAGIHPHDSVSVNEDAASWLSFEVIAQASECVAIGPCGLDFLRNFSEPHVQKKIFEKQIGLACRFNKPLLVHERAAQVEVMEILSKFSHLPEIIIHGFAGTYDEALKYIEKKYYLGLTGYLCKDKSDCGIRKLLMDSALPLDQLLVETDSPFMYPNTRASKLPPYVKTSFTERSLLYLHRYCTFQRNEPCSLPIIVEMIAALMKKTPEEVALATAFNALKLFDLSQ